MLASEWNSADSEEVKRMATRNVELEAENSRVQSENLELRSTVQTLQKQLKKLRSKTCQSAGIDEEVTQVL